MGHQNFPAPVAPANFSILACTMVRTSQTFWPPRGGVGVGWGGGVKGLHLGTNPGPLVRHKQYGYIDGQNWPLRNVRNGRPYEPSLTQKKTPKRYHEPSCSYHLHLAAPAKSRQLIVDVSGLSPPPVLKMEGFGLGHVGGQKLCQGCAPYLSCSCPRVLWNNSLSVCPRHLRTTNCAHICAINGPDTNQLATSLEAGS